MRYATALLILIALAVQVARSQSMTTASFKTTDGANLVYRTVGSGMPIVLLSGGPGFSSDHLAAIADSLGTDYQAILFDQRGAGLSAETRLDTSTINLRRAISDLEDLRVHLKQEELLLLGHSWGGMLAMSYAAAHPERVRSLLLIAPGGLNRDFLRYFSSNIESRLLPSDREAQAFWTDSARVARNPKRAHFENVRAILPAYVFDRKHALALIAEMDEDTYNVEMANLMLQSLGTYELAASLKALSRPVLILHGRQDPIGESTAYQIRDAVSGAELHFIEKSGHFPWIEQPDEFYAQLEQFLEKLKHVN